MNQSSVDSVRPDTTTARHPAENARYPFEFRAQGGEYFRIWIVNLALSLLTLGIYSAWAKVRRLRYFYGSTSVAGSSFEYHGEPLKILKGRAIAAAMIVPYSIASRFNPVLALVLLLAFLCALPIFLVKSRRFQNRMSSWRGIRFDFLGSYREAIRIQIGLSVLVSFTLGLGYPYWLYARERFLIGRSSYGTEQLEFNARAGSYYGAFLMAGVIILIVIVGAALLLHPPLAKLNTRHAAELGLGVWRVIAFFALVAIAFVMARAVAQARIINATFGNTTIGGHEIKCELSGTRLAWISVTNALMTFATLGLYAPWARVRMLRYQFASMSLQTYGSLDEFVASESAQVSATGSEVGDLLDLDFGL